MGTHTTLCLVLTYERVMCTKKPSSGASKLSGLIFSETPATLLCQCLRT